MPDMSGIKLENVTRSFSGRGTNVVALSDVSLE